MSVKVSSWVWHGEETADIGGNEMILLLALADVADDNGRCRFVDEESGLTYDALASKVRVDRRTIERLIPKLRERGLVTHVKGAKGRPNEFAIAVPWLAASTDNLSGNASEASADSPTVVQDSPTAATTFPDNGRIRTSIQRINVTTDVVPAQKRGSRIPDPFVVTPEMVSWAKSHAPLVDGARSTERFVNYWTAKTRDATKLDWERTWRNWLLKDQEEAERRGPAKLTPSQRAAQTLALADEQLAVGA